jgi:hypothetical protein
MIRLIRTSFLGNQSISLDVFFQLVLQPRRLQVDHRLFYDGVHGTRGFLVIGLVGIVSHLDKVYPSILSPAKTPVGCAAKPSCTGRLLLHWISEPEE